MQLGILGFPKAGKTTLFNLMTDSDVATDKFSQSSEAHVAVAKLPDRRLEQLRDLFDPKKYTPATVQYVDIPGIRRGEGPEQLDLAELKNVDALVHVVRAFDDPEILHPEGSVDPERDLTAIDLELILSDHEIVERRLEKLEQAKKRGLTSDEQREQALLSDTILPALEAETSLRELELDPDDEKRLRGFQLLSAKPMLVVVNVDEARVADATPGSFGLAARAQTASVVISAPIEQEISRLPADEQAEFLSDLGISEPSVDRVVRASYDLLGLISFFTVGEDEVRAWTIRRGTVARSAAGAIHSDLERGFIRAEVVPWGELIEKKTLAACRDAGTLRLEGKDYVVADGDVVHVRFNV